MAQLFLRLCWLLPRGFSWPGDDGPKRPRPYERWRQVRMSGGNHPTRAASYLAAASPHTRPWGQLGGGSGPKTKWRDTLRRPPAAQAALEARPVLERKEALNDLDMEAGSFVRRRRYPAPAPLLLGDPPCGAPRAAAQQRCGRLAQRARSEPQASVQVAWAHLPLLHGSASWRCSQCETSLKNRGRFSLRMIEGPVALRRSQSSTCGELLLPCFRHLQARSRPPSRRWCRALQGTARTTMADLPCRSRLSSLQRLSSGSSSAESSVAARVGESL